MIKDYALLPRLALAPKKDWCTLVPDFDVGYCCKQHDKDYDKIWMLLGAGEIDKVEARLRRKIADQEFRACIEAHGWKVGKKARYRELATVYYYGVRVFGWIRFKRDRSLELPICEEDYNGEE